MNKKVAQSNKTYQIRPPFKDKFRPGVINFHLFNNQNLFIYLKS